MTDNCLEQLKSICYQRAYALYGAEFFGGYKSRLDYEFDRISSIPGGAEAFLKTREFIGKIKNLWKSQKNKRGSRFAGTKPRLTFRGPVLAGLAAYLCGITEYDPVEWGFYAWTFFLKSKVMEFNLDVTIEMYDLIREYDLKVPSCVILRIDIDQSVLEEAEARGEMTRYNFQNSQKALQEIDGEIKNFFREVMEKNTDEALTYIWDENEQMAADAVSVLTYLGEIDQLPESLGELSRLNAFLHNTLREGTRLQMLQAIPELYVYGSMIAYPEDVYETLAKEGCSREEAQRIAKIVQRAGRTLTMQEERLLEDYCGRTYALLAAQTEHLFYKSQVFGKSMGVAELIRWYNHEPETLRTAYAWVTDR
ncbi:MAG: hypothetical protein IJ794_00945 [Lachnospiraceae bacterium]|nr:hypothetical protein [Lachnospiraceae bacterium]